MKAIFPFLLLTLALGAALPAQAQEDGGMTAYASILSPVPTAPAYEDQDATAAQERRVARRTARRTSRRQEKRQEMKQANATPPKEAPASAAEKSAQ